MWCDMRSLTRGTAHGPPADKTPLPHRNCVGARRQYFVSVQAPWRRQAAG